MDTTHRTLKALAVIGILSALRADKPACAEDRPSDLPWKVNSPIVSVQKELYRRHPKPGAAALASVCYLGPKLDRIEVQSLEIIDDAPGSVMRRFSSDNGRTWSAFTPLPDTLTHVKGVEVREFDGPVAFDPSTGLLVGMWLREIPIKGKWNCFTYHRHSRDLGKTWTRPEQLRYEAGDEFDPEEPLKPSFLNFNQAYTGNNILLCRNGSLVHCVVSVNDPGDPDNEKRAWKMAAMCFIGKWDAKAKTYRWTPGRRIAVSPDVSSRGLMEPELAELSDKRLLIVWRGSDTRATPGRKWYSVSTDGGVTLSAPAEWKYDDGSRFYSPSSYHRLLRHSVTGKLYWFGNICAEPPRGNSPRYPLVIAEVDEKIPALKRATVTAIDDRQPGQSPSLQFSNFSLLENRETHVLEMFLTTYGQDPASVFSADCYRYILTLK